MKRKMILIQGLLIVVLSILCCFALFGCGGGDLPIPEVKDVTITAADGVSYGKAGALHQVSYTATEGSKVATSVKKAGDVVATIADYSYVDGGYIFYTAGEYVVTVYASKDGMLGQASANITVRDGQASVSDLKLNAAAGETKGRVGALHVLSYTADAECNIEVQIKKRGEIATDAIFDGVYNTIVFRSAGSYTITVKATLGSSSDSAALLIAITAAANPSVEFSLDKNQVKEDEEVTLTHAVSYQSGDARLSESVSVLYRTGASGEFLAAEEETYGINGDRFAPFVAGEWKLVYKAQSKGGAEGEASVTLRCAPAEIELSLKARERQRIQTEKPTEIDYLVEGAADKYNVTYDLHQNDRIEAEKGDGNSVRVTAQETDYFTVTVIYTHKVDSSVQKKIDVNLYSVESLAYAPSLGEDPFGGMPSEVLTSMGYMFYFDATACKFHNLPVTYRDLKYEVLNKKVTAGASVGVSYAADDIDYPYVLVSNFGNNSATGSFTVRMTVTDPATGYSAIATKDFTVKPTNGNAGVIRDYVKNTPFYNGIGQMNFDIAASKYSHENMVLTKTGTIMHRRNASDFDTGDFAHLDFAKATGNCRLEFKFTALGANPDSGEIWLGIGLRTVTSSGWAGFFDLHVVGGKFEITNGLAAAKEEQVFSTARVAAIKGTVMYVRIDRRVNGNLAEYTAYVKTEGSAYEPYYRCTYAVSTSAGNAGAPVNQYQFTHRNKGGCYLVENAIVTSYDA